MRKIILNSKKEYEVDRCGAAEGNLYIGFPDGVITFKEAVEVFSDEKATSHIISTYDFDGMETVFDGYTELISIAVRHDKGILLLLRNSGTTEVIIP